MRVISKAPEPGLWQCACLSVLLLFAVHGPTCAADSDVRVEIRLAADLDEPRGYCLDIVGHRARANPAQGIHAHTCYSYQGQLATDQAFNAAALGEGLLHLPDWSVCITWATAEGARRITLETCDGRREQRFTFDPGGTIRPRFQPDQCLSVRDAPGRPGGGGRPPHLIRALTVEPCSIERATWQRWRIPTAIR